MKKKLHQSGVGLVACLLVASITGCAGPAKTAATSPARSEAGNPAVAKVVGEAFSGGLQEELAPKVSPEDAKYAGRMSSTPILAGKVVETMDAGNYSYLLLEKDGKVAWAAVPATEVKVGDQVELIPGIDMGTFSSATLKRTFTSIHFSAGIKSTDAKKGAPAAKAAEASRKPVSADAPLPPGHPALPQMAAPEKPAAVALAGKVVETMEGGGYTYLCLEKEGKKMWAAVPPMQATVGQEVAVSPGMEMTNFSSTSLKRTFDKIIFSSGATVR